MIWEFYEDKGYFHMWAVKRVEDTDFNSQELFHVATREEAIALSALLNGYEMSKVKGKH